MLLFCNYKCGKVQPTTKTHLPAKVKQLHFSGQGALYWELWTFSTHSNWIKLQLRSHFIRGLQTHRITLSHTVLSKGTVFSKRWNLSWLHQNETLQFGHTRLLNVSVLTLHRKFLWRTSHGSFPLFSRSNGVLMVLSTLQVAFYLSV